MRQRRYNPRWEDVMTRFALLLAGLSIAALPLAAQSNAPRFEVVSVKPNVGSDLSILGIPTPPEGLTMINRSLESIVRYAFRVDDKRLSGVPAWAFDERFDINAKVSRPISDDERRQMVQSLLIDRFHLKTRRKPREQHVYVVTRLRPDGPLGPGLRPQPGCDAGAQECVRGGSANPNGGKLSIRGATITQLADGMLTALVESVVRDESNIPGVCDVELSWRPISADANDPRPALFTAIEEQLGLKLNPTRRPVDMIVIESIQRPTPD
jgi:uncharacterized protein (TIGR03435 family)